MCSLLIQIMFFWHQLKSYTLFVVVNKGISFLVCWTDSIIEYKYTLPKPLTLLAKISFYLMQPTQ